MALGEKSTYGTSITKCLYRLNGNANDSSGNGANGTATNITWINGFLGTGAASYNGTSSVIQGTDWYSGSGSYVVMGWFNSSVSPTSGDYNIMWRYSDGSGYDTARVYYGGYGTNAITWKWCTGSTADANNTFTISINPSTNTWHHYAFVIDDTNKYAKFYFNGSFHSQQSYTGSASKSNRAGPFYYALGNRWYSANECWAGYIDENICEQRLRTDIEIKNYYTSMRGRFGIL